MVNDATQSAALKRNDGGLLMLLLSLIRDDAFVAVGFPGSECGEQAASVSAAQAERVRSIQPPPPRLPASILTASLREG